MHAHACDMQLIDHDHKLTTRSVAQRLDVSVRTIERWMERPHVGFPPPVMRTYDATGRVSCRFWRLGDILEWERIQGSRQ